MKKYNIEREILQLGTLDGEQMRQAAARSNEALRQLATGIQGFESFVAAGKTFGVHLAKDEAIIRRYAALGGFPAGKVTESGKMIGTTTGDRVK